jgi:glycosyltransferase involved in cell wall biosynthesis
MQIYFDARWTRTERHDGVSRYGAELATALAKQHPITLIICDKKQLKLLPTDVPYIIVNNPMSPRELLLPFKLNRLGADMVFSPLQIMGIWGRKYKLILTLQDMIYYRNPKPPTFLPAPARAAWWLFHQAYWPQRLLLNQADYVTTVSKKCKSDIEAAHLTKRSIGVIYNAPAVTLDPLKSNTVKKDIVYMGSFMPYKNVELLLRTLPLLSDYRLHLTSPIKPERRSELEKLIPDASRVTFWNGISDEAYATLLSTATALVSASKDEGFGLPLIEAMQVGTPVACTDMPIFREVADDAALFFDPDSPEQLAAAIRQFEDLKTRQAYIARGHKRAQTFSWQNSAAELLRIMRELLGQK